MEVSETSFNEMQTVKRRFFAMRNGVIADVLRRSGSPFRIIFGLNLPQIVEIAAETPHSRDLAERLWANDSTRESMLMAPMLVDADEFSLDDARRWLSSAKAHEVVDVLCLKLLRRLPDALSLAESLVGNADPLMRYAAVRLAFNVVAAAPVRCQAIAAKVLNGEDDTSIAALARQLDDECSFLLEEDE